MFVNKMLCCLELASCHREHRYRVRVRYPVSHHRYGQYFYPDLDFDRVLNPDPEHQWFDREWVTSPAGTHTRLNLKFLLGSGSGPCQRFGIWIQQINLRVIGVQIQSEIFIRDLNPALEYNGDSDPDLEFYGDKYPALDFEKNILKWSESLL